MEGRRPRYLLHPQIWCVYPMSVFNFKQFSVNQANCAMKINTDGVLVGALAEAGSPENIMDIGTGTGVIALMLAQRFANAHVDAVEIDEVAAETARANFSGSQFADRMAVHATSFEVFFEQHPDSKYDLIVSNPPFFLNSLEAIGAKKNLARHTDEGFYKRLLTAVAQHLTDNGTYQLVLPVQTANLVKTLLARNQLYLHKQLAIRSFTTDVPHREILVFGRDERPLKEESFVIYVSHKVYSQEYKTALKDFLTIF